MVLPFFPGAWWMRKLCRLRTDGKRCFKPIYRTLAQRERIPHTRRVPHVRLIEEDEARGPLRAEYDAAVERAGKVFNIVKAMSLRPSVLKRSIDLYLEVMKGPSELSRQERELLAVVVSRTNDCHY
jgi:alkylhydroperoxidase family enzyme